MRINDYRAAQIAQNYGLQNAADPGTKAQKQGQRPDATSLSTEAQGLLKARRAVHDAPEVRADLVAELRRQVQSGSYRIDDHAIARRLLPQLDLEA